MFAAGGGGDAGPSATRTTIGLTTFIALIRPMGRTALIRITDHDDSHDVRRLLRRMAILDHAPHRVK